MKFLLTQRLNFEKKGWMYYIYPNQFSSQFIRIANKKKVIIKINEKWKNRHRIVESYEIYENNFKKIYRIYKKNITQKRERFYRRKPLIQLFLILEYIYKRNNRAKEVSKRSAKYKAYDDKDEFLRIALEIAKKIDNKAFSYGWQEDVNAINYEYVYYFQYKNKQVSFHSPNLHLDCPEFEGQWCGVSNSTFPFSIPKGLRI